MMRKVLLAALAVVCASLVIAPAGLAAKPGNSPNAKLCQKGGWQTLVRSDGSPFASEAECVSYGAAGGTINESASISGFFFSGCADSTLVGVTGTGFTPNHGITLTATGFGPNGLIFNGSVTTDANGAFDSRASWAVYVYVADGPQTIHITASDGVHMRVTEVTFTSC